MVIKAAVESETEGTTRMSIKTILETGVKSDPAFCLGPSIEKRNCGAQLCRMAGGDNFALEQFLDTISQGKLG